MRKLKRRKQAKIIRIARKIHRYTGVFLFAFFFIIGITGFLLGWKQQFGGVILPKAQKGTSTNLQNWLPIDSLHKKATFYLQKNIEKGISTKIRKIDIRQEKGIVKFIFKDHYYGVQLDGATGKLLAIAYRNSDLIEDLHDGSFIDKLLGTQYKQFEMFYTLIMSLALVTFTMTGFWLWYGPKRMKKNNSKA